MSRERSSFTSRHSRFCSRCHERASSSASESSLLWLLLASERVRSGLLLLAAGCSRRCVAGWAFTRPALTEDLRRTRTGLRTERSSASLALVGASGRRARRHGRSTALAERRRRAEQLGRVLVAAAVVLVVAAAAAASRRGRRCGLVGPELLRGRERSESPRLARRRATVCAGGGRRWTSSAPRTEGRGRRHVRDRAQALPTGRAARVLQPHSVPLQQLADGGVSALALFVLARPRGGSRRLRLRAASPARAGAPAAVALVAAPAAYLAHALVDYNWDFLAVTAPTMVALGVARRRRATRLRRGAGGRSSVSAVVLLAAVVLVSFSFPRLADRAERRSTRALVAGDFGSALDQAHWARFFNPLSADPLFALARVAERQRRPLACRATLHRRRRAPAGQSAHLVHARHLRVRRAQEPVRRLPLPQQRVHPRSRTGTSGSKGGPLDVARDAVNEGGCAAAGDRLASEPAARLAARG